MVLSGWLEMNWNDFNLKWNPHEYGNITKLHIQSSKIWIPGLYIIKLYLKSKKLNILLLDIILYNSFSDSFDPKSNVNVIIWYSGQITYIPPGIFKTCCPIHIENFPFDEFAK